MSLHTGRESILRLQTVTRGKTVTHSILPLLAVCSSVFCFRLLPFKKCFQQNWWNWCSYLGVLFLCWPGMVPNQRQLIIVVSDWGSYLGNHFPTVFCGILFWVSACCTAYVTVPCLFPFCFVSFTKIKVWNSEHAAPWSVSPHSSDTVSQSTSETWALSVNWMCFASTNNRNYTTTKENKHLWGIIGFLFNICYSLFLFPSF